jgi:hypothetical protein
MSHRDWHRSIRALVAEGRQSRKYRGIGTFKKISNPYQAMHMGVIRDFEQQRVKRERQADFEMQRELEQEYRKYQTVSDGGPAEPPPQAR